MSESFPDNPSDLPDLSDWLRRRGPDCLEGRVLADGVNLVVFPEGTRGDGVALLPLKRGAAQLSIRCRAPVVVVRLSCDPLVLGKGMRWWDACDRRSVYSLAVCGEVVPPPDCGPVAARTMTDEISAMLKGK